MKIKTLAEALALVPEFWPLTPGDSCLKGDIVLGPNGVWIERDCNLNRKIDKFDAIQMRPIPQSVRESEARRIIDCQEPDDIDLPLWRWVAENRA